MNIFVDYIITGRTVVTFKCDKYKEFPHNRNRLYVATRNIKIVSSGIPASFELSLDGVGQGIFKSVSQALTLVIALSAAIPKHAKKDKKPTSAIRSEGYFRPTQHDEINNIPEKKIGQFERLVLKLIPLVDISKILNLTPGQCWKLLRRSKRLACDFDLPWIYPHLIALWSPLNAQLNLRPNDDFDRRRVHWQCHKMSYHSYKSTIIKQIKYGCPYCAGELTHAMDRSPWLVEQYHRDLNANLDISKLKFHSQQQLWWTCASGHTTRSKLSTWAKPGINCEVCKEEIRYWKNTDDAAEFFQTSNFRCDDPNRDKSLTDVMRDVRNGISLAI
jgi:hypothetical protein